MITKNLLHHWDACWSDERIDRYFGGRTALTPHEIAEDVNIRRGDRLWVLTQALVYRNDDAARTFAIDSAALVTHLAGRQKDGDGHAQLLSELRSIFQLPRHNRAAELQEWSAAWDASRDQACDAARAVEWAAQASLREAWDAARDAALDITWPAAWHATMDASRATIFAVATPSWECATTASSRDRAMAAALDGAIQRALVALGTDASGWTE